MKLCNNQFYYCNGRSYLYINGFHWEIKYNCITVFMRFKLLLLALLIIIAFNKTVPLDGVGTTLPLLTETIKYRIFNDLFKQSTVFVPYKFMYGNFGRAWN